MHRPPCHPGKGWQSENTPPVTERPPLAWHSNRPASLVPQVLPSVRTPYLPERPLSAHAPLLSPSLCAQLSSAQLSLPGSRPSLLLRQWLPLSNAISVCFSQEHTSMPSWHTHTRTQSLLQTLPRSRVHFSAKPPLWVPSPQALGLHPGSHLTARALGPARLSPPRSPCFPGLPTPWGPSSVLFQVRLPLASSGGPGARNPVPAWPLGSRVGRASQM